MKKTICLIKLFLSLFAVLAPHPLIAAPPLKIAAVFAKSGDAQFVSPYLFRGVRLAVDQLNAAGGVLGRDLELIELDNKGTALGSRIAANQSIQQQVLAVIGANWSSHSLAMAPILQNAGIPMITPISTHPEVTQQGNYIFRICFVDTLAAEVMSRFAIEDLQARSAVILTNLNSDYSIGVSRYFKTAFRQRGGSIVFEGRYQQEDTDFTALLDQVKRRDPRVIFLPGYSRESSLILRQAQKKGIDSIFINSGSWSKMIYALSADEMDGSFMADLWHEEGDFPKSRPVVERYQHKYGEFTESSMLLSYDAVMVLADAIRRANAFDRRRIRTALASTKNYEGVTGDITFDPQGDPILRNVVIVKFGRSGLNYVKTIEVNKTDESIYAQPDPER